MLKTHLVCELTGERLMSLKIQRGEVLQYYLSMQTLLEFGIQNLRVNVESASTTIILFFTAYTL